MLISIQLKAQTNHYFNNTSELTTFFNPSKPTTMINAASGGLSGSGCVKIPYSSGQVWTSKAGFRASVKGSDTVSAFFFNGKSVGYGGIGFTIGNSNQSGTNTSGGPAIGLGMAFHGGGGSFVNNNVETPVSWYDKIGDLKKESWYKMVFILTSQSINNFKIEFQIWESDKNGKVGTMITQQTIPNAVNPLIGGATSLYPYFSSNCYGSKFRFVAIDNFYYNSSVGLLTTLDATIVPDSALGKAPAINDPANFEKNGYGKWHYGPGKPYEKLLTLMPTSYNGSSVRKTSNLLRFFTISDIHITDKESPAQAIVFRIFSEKNAISIYTPLMLYTTQVLDATVQTINNLHQTNSFNFGLALGDLANSTQYNELRWFIDALDGKTINPHSGLQFTSKDTIPDYQKPYKAVGLNHNIPWYAAMGNHDHFWMGSKPVSEKLRKAYIGDSILQLGNILDTKDTNAMNETTYSTGTLDGKTPYGTIIGEGKVDTLINIPLVVPDSNRHSLTKTEWMKEFRTTGTLPVGHGFGQNDDTPKAYYSFISNTTIPIKVIVIDDTQNDNDKPSKDGIYGHGELDSIRYNWLMAQLDSGQKNNQLMIIAAHVPIGVEDSTSAMSWLPTPGYFQNEKELISKLKSFSNLILWVSGHRHLSTITPFPSESIKIPENSFWEVETKSLREFPEQLRTFDIALNNDTTISIFATNVDPFMKDSSLAAIGRSYAIASNQIYGLQDDSLRKGSVKYNAELVKPLSPEMKKILADKFFFEMPLYRYFNGKEHFYTTNWSELGKEKDGYKYEGISGYVLPANSNLPNTVPLHRYYNGNDHFYTTNWNELGDGKSGYKYEGVACNVYSVDNVPNTAKLYRYFNSKSGDHFYTTNWTELGNEKGGYKYEGVACYIKTSAN